MIKEFAGNVSKCHNFGKRMKTYRDVNKCIDKVRLQLTEHCCDNAVGPVAVLTLWTLSGHQQAGHTGGQSPDRSVVVKVI